MLITEKVEVKSSVANHSFEQKELGNELHRDTVVFVARDPEIQQVRALGSGVFVAGDYVLTARHVYQEAWRLLGGNQKSKFDTIAPFFIEAYSFPDGGQIASWGVDSAWDTPFSDMALVRVVPHDDIAANHFPHTVSVLNAYPPQQGEKVTGVGFPRTQLKHDRVNLSLGLNPAVTTGIVTHVYENYRDKGMLNFPCFEVGAHVYGGMSGGPIYNESMELCGIICASLEGSPIFYGLSLWPSLFIQITHDYNHQRMNPGPYFGEFGRGTVPMVNSEEAMGRHHIVVDPDTQKQRLLLRSMEAYLNKWPAPAATPAGEPVFDGTLLKVT